MNDKPFLQAIFLSFVFALHYSCATHSNTILTQNEAEDVEPKDIETKVKDPETSPMGESVKNQKLPSKKGETKSASSLSSESSGSPNSPSSVLHWNRLVPELEASDQLFKKRADRENALQALENYRNYFKDHPSDPAGAWRVSLACYFVGIRLTKESNQKRKIHTEGKEAGEKGVQLDPNCTPCHFWTAINMALYGEATGVLKTLFSLASVEKHLEKSIQLDPTYAYAGAYRLLGLIEQKLPGILGGNNDEARAHFENALKFGPEEPLNYLFMARLLEEEFDERNGAIQIAKRGLEVPPPTPERLEALDALKDLKKFIEEHPTSKD